MSGTGQVSRALALDVLQSAERLDLTNDAWLAGLLRAAMPSIGNERVYGSIIEMSPRYSIEVCQASGCEPSLLHAMASQLTNRCSTEEKQRWSQMRGLQSFRENGRASPNAVAIAQSLGITEMLGVFADAGMVKVISLASLYDAPVRPTAMMRRFWARLAPHMGRAHALRGRLAEASESPAATFGPDGRCVHASPSTAPSTIEGLRAHVLRREQGRRRGSDVETVVDAWTAIVERRWTIVDQFDSDGRRWLVAWDNPLGAADPRALSSAEERIVVGLLEGRANIDIARELDMPLSAVSRALSSALRKLRIRDLGMLASLRGAVAASIPSLAPDRLYAVGVPLVRAEMLGSLTRAEREIVPLLIDGRSNADVALLRGTSERTVANQVHSIFDKLGVGSRRELVRYLGAPVTAPIA